MFIRFIDSRFKEEMWSDSRLTNKQLIFCLCGKCIKEQSKQGKPCSIHTEFMKITKQLKVAAPVFACVDFVENPERSSLIDPLYEPSQERIEMAKVEGAYQFAKDWETQKKRWGLNDRLELKADS